MPKGVYVRGKNNLTPRDKPAKEVLEERIDKNGPVHPVHGQCWVYVGSKSRGYGEFRGKKAHRVWYEVNVGPIPDGMLVCHHCDNPSCLRLSHLFLGTAQDNMTDKTTKGRQSRVGTRTPPKGEKNVKAVLTEKDVLYLRSVYKPKHKEFGAVPLGRKYRVSPETISLAVHGKTWSHL